MIIKHFIEEIHFRRRTVKKKKKKKKAHAGATANAQCHLSAMALLLGDGYATHHDTGVDGEFQKFIQETPPPLDCTPTGWWRVNGVRFPEVGEISEEVFVHPGHVCPVREGILSGRTDGDQNSVTPDTRACEYAHISEQK